jgi:hypothetical protein
MPARLRQRARHGALDMSAQPQRLEEIRLRRG